MTKFTIWVISNQDNYYWVDNFMNRRSFLTVLGAGFGFSALVHLFKVNKKSRPCPGLAFYVAGVRFHSSIDPIIAGSRVVFEEGHWQNQKSIRILTDQGRRIGYVPQQFVALVDAKKHDEWRITVCNPHAVPWKRYRVSLLNGFEIS